MTKNPLIDRILKTSSIELKSVLSDSDIFNNKDVIPTPIPIINGAFSGDYDGGIVSGLTILAGQSKSFKSMLGLLCMKSYLDKYPEAVAIIYDCEGGITTSYLKSFGIDADRVVLMPFNHLEELKFDLTKQLVAAKRGDKVFIFVDSIGNAASLKELQDAIDEKSVADMQRAKFIKGLFRIITPSLVSKDIPCVMIAHVYSEMGMFPRTIVSGGCLIEGTRIVMADGSLREIQEVLVGEEVSTLSGPKKVLNTWDPDTLDEGEPECYEIELSDGSSVTCSGDHKFMNEHGEWISAKELVEGQKLQIS